MTYQYPMPFTEVARRQRPRRLLVVGIAAVLAMALGVGAAWHPVRTDAARSSVTILGIAPTSLDPAQMDAGSAQVVSQLFESLTKIDSAQQVQPTLAASWEIEAGGKRVVFHLRPGLTFSDGTALTAADVVASWMRVLAPEKPGDLASLLDSVVGARAYREGTGPASTVGIHSSGDSDVQVDLTGGASDLPAIVSNPTFAVVPRGLNASMLAPGTFVGSGAYVLSALTDTETTLTANSRYWAGKSAITTVHLLTSLGDSNPVEEFEAGNLDYTQISSGDAAWIAYDRALGPCLRVEDSPYVEYYGFNTTKAPFSDVHVRRAFQLGVDWRRIVALMGEPLVVPATGMVPAGVPGHSEDFGPKFDLARAKSELAAAGYANGVGFPKVTMVTWTSTGQALERAIVRQLHDNLGIDVAYRAMHPEAYNARLLEDPPDIWVMDWTVDYPGANDFLGLLLGSGEPNNFGRWSNSQFDQAIERALAASDATSMQQAFDEAQGIVLDQAPVIPVYYGAGYYGAGYALAAKGLLGAQPNSQGLMRYAGLAWANGS